MAKSSPDPELDWAFQHPQSPGGGVKSDPKKKIVIAAQKKALAHNLLSYVKVWDINYLFKPHLEPGINYLTLASKIKRIIKIAEIDVSFFWDVIYACRFL